MRSSMSETLRERLYSLDRAFEHPVTLWAVILIGVALVVPAGVVLTLRLMGKISTRTFRELMLRWRFWLFLIPLAFAPLLVGALWFMLAVCAFSLFCYQEFARATGLFREKTISLVV